MKQTSCKYNVAIIGMGSQGYTTWFEFLHKGAKIAISAVCDNSSAVVEAFKVRHPGVPAYTDLARLLEHHHTVTFAIVCAPNKYHVSITEQLAAAGISCLKEKPVANTLAEFQVLYRIPVKIGVAFQRRWQPRFVHLRNLLSMIGKPLSVRATLAGAYNPPQDGWRITHYVGTFEDLGVHILDAIVWLFGRPSTVYSLRVNDAPLPARDRESHVAMTWGDGGLVGHLYVSEVALGKEECVIVRGELGSLHLEGNKITHFNCHGRETFQTMFQSSKEDTLSAMCEEFGNFVTAKSAFFGSSVERLEDSLLTSLAVRDSFLSRKLEVVSNAKLNGVICATPPPETSGFAKESRPNGELKNDETKQDALKTSDLKNGNPTSNSVDHAPRQNGAMAINPTHFVLNTGDSIPALGFGTRKPKKPNQVYEAVKAAFAAGYRHIDSAFRYNNEGQVGMAVRDSGLPRSEVWITTKVDNSWHDRVAESVSLSLSKLGMDYIDLLLMHWPTATMTDDPKTPLLDWDFIMTWQYMQKEFQTGRVRNIGVSNFGIRNLKKLLSHPTCAVIPAVNQLELHPCCPSSGLVEFCKDKGIHCTAYSPLACGLPQLYENAKMKDICKRTGKTPQQILIRWGLQRGTSVIPKTVTPERIFANFDVAEWQLSPEEHSLLSSLEARFRVYPDDWLPERVFWEEDN